MVSKVPRRRRAQEGEGFPPRESFFCLHHPSPVVNSCHDECVDIRYGLKLTVLECLMG